jgi:hypothetical protein
VHVELVVLGRPAAPDRPHRSALADGVTLANDDRAEMEQRDRIAVERLDRHRLAPAGHSSGVGHGSRGGRDHVRAAVAGHVDAAVLTARIGIVPEHKGPEHLA